MIRRIKVSQYRCFHSLDIELTPHQVLAGANGSGKTTLLDIPTLFGELLASHDINQVFFEPTPSQNSARASNPIELIHQLQGDTFFLSLTAHFTLCFPITSNHHVRGTGKRHTSKCD